MSDNSKVNPDEQKKNKESNYKKFLLYGILLVLVVLVGYVIFVEDKKMYRLTTETRQGLREEVGVTSSGSSSSSFALFPSSSSSSSSMPLTSATSSAVPPVEQVMLSSTSGGSASEVRRELRDLFRSYA